MIFKTNTSPWPLLCAAAIAAGPVVAQDRNAARGLHLDASLGLEAASNPELVADPQRDQLALRSELDLRYFTSTGLQRLDFAIGGAFEAGDFAERGESPRVADKRISFGYERNSVASTLTFDARYNRALVEDSTLVEGFEGDDLQITSGERGTGRLSFGLETGKDRPFGVIVNAGYNSIRYFDSDGSGRDTLDYDTTLRMSAGRRTDILLLTGVQRKDYDNSEQFQSETFSAGLGLRHDLTEHQRIYGELRSARVETSEISDLSGLRETDRQTGPTGLLDYQIDIGRHTFGASYESVLINTGRRDMVSLTQNTKLAGGELKLSAGVVDSDLLDQRPVFGAEWTQDIASGTLQVELTQEPFADEDEEAIRTRFGVGWLGEINSISSWEAGLTVAGLNEYGPTAVDSQRSEVTVGYRHALAQDWDMALRYRHVLSESDQRNDRKNDSVFLGLSTRVDIRP